MAKSDAFAALRYLGKNSIVVYLAFFLGMAASRSVLLKIGIDPGPRHGRADRHRSGIAGAVALFWAVRNTPLRFLFERPAWARLEAQAEVRAAAGGVDAPQRRSRAWIAGGRCEIAAARPYIRRMAKSPRNPAAAPPHRVP